MPDIVIVHAMRTPIGRRGGWLRDHHPVQLGSLTLNALLERVPIDPTLIDHVIMGCVSQVAEQTFNLARNVVLDAGLPVETAATTIDFQCGSSQQALHLAAGMIASGQAEVVIAGGVESMTRTPLGSSLPTDGRSPFTDRIMTDHNIIGQGAAADEIAQRWQVTRAVVDQIGYDSHRKAAQAAAQGVFQREFFPITGVDDKGEAISVTSDEGVRPNANLEKMAALQSAFTPKGVTTAGNSSQISDGAAALLVMSAEKAEALHLSPRARLVSMVTVGSDPHLMLTGPVAATRKVLARAGLTMDDIDLFEVNEAFAAVIAMWHRDMKAPMEKINVYGGAIALGHPLGASGARLMTTLINALELGNKRYGLQTMCCGGGMATATIIERL